MKIYLVDLRLQKDLCIVLLCNRFLTNLITLCTVRHRLSRLLLRFFLYPEDLLVRAALTSTLTTRATLEVSIYAKSFCEGRSH